MAGLPPARHMAGGPHRPTVAAAAVAVLVAIAALITALSAGGAPSNQHIVNRAQGNLKARAVETATKVANTTPPALDCNPPGGAGVLGSCAPKQADAAAGTLAKAAGDPFDVSHLGPIGIDVSSYQPCGVTGPSFSFYKATESLGYTDRCLRANVAASKRAHKPYGVYHFLRPSYSHTAEQEAAHFVAAIRAAGANTSLPPVADLEANAGLSPANLVRYTCRFQAAVRAALHRSVSILYVGYYFYPGGSRCGSIVWVPAYGPQAYTPRGFDHKVAWQHSDGRLGPTPHIHGWDSDVWLGKGPESLAALSGARPAGPPRASAAAQRLCTEATAIRHRRHTGAGTAADRRRLRTLKHVFRRHRVACHGGVATRA